MRPRTGIAAFVTALSAAGVLTAATTAGASTSPAASQGQGQQGQGNGLVPGDLLVSTSTYASDPNIVAGKTLLPPVVAGKTLLPPGSSAPVTAVAGGGYPQVFNNDTVDPSFGVTSPLTLRELTPGGRPVDTIQVPASQLSTSFSSKSEGALNLSTDGKYVTFMGYAAPSRTIDASNSNTPAAPDPTNPVPSAYYRAVGQLSRNGSFSFTETNAYSGNNGRAAAEASVKGKDYIYTAGNAGNGSNPQPDGIILGAGAQILRPSSLPESRQNPGTPTPVGGFSVTQLGDKADKVGKDTNFRGLTIFDNVLYYTKGSGSNGVNTVYFLDTTGKACPDGVGVPQPGAALPTEGLAVDESTLQSGGLPTNMCVLKGFPTALAKGATDASDYPFGLWFANPDTLYVADEGSGDNAYSGGTYTAAAASTTAGLQKWVLDKATGQWNLAYTLRSGLNLGTPYTVKGYPAGTNSVTGLPWAPATDGLRNITGRVNPNGTVSIWGVTSTVSGGGDQGADPNQLVEITDPVNAASPAAGEKFAPVVAPRDGQVVRGVSFTPGT
jgi:hypothetical protein